MTFNIQQLFNMGPKTWWDQGNRAARIPGAVRSFCLKDNGSECPDVLILNEAFNPYAAGIALQLMDIFPHQTPVIGKSLVGWKATTGKFRNNYNTINGGVTILSRHTIVEQRQYIYAATHPNTWDCWANKGIAYAKVSVKGTMVHILGTHLQADEGHVPHIESHKVRMAQLREMRQYLLEDLKLSKEERVVIGGDLNVEYTTEPFRKDLESNLQVKICYEHKLPGSFSAPDNWMTRANARSNKEPEDRNETLDYVLVPTEFAPSFRDPVATVIPLKAAESWYWSYLAQEWPAEGGMTLDLSDHYPVMATFEFEISS